MSRKSTVPWWAADEAPEAKEVKAKERVNDDGAPVALGDGRDAHEPGGNGTGLFYCGRQLGEEAIADSDGQCGPWGGPQCPSCKRFQAHQESRYDVGSDLQNLFNLPGGNVRLIQDRVKGKVQQILAGRELSDTTIGKLRATLEEKLGLPADSLQSTKRLRKWVCQVLEQEVLKKTQRSNKCERICQALADMETYPDNCRRMLMEALPSAMAHPEGLLTGGDPPHPHQVRILETVQIALKESLDHVQAQSNASETQQQSDGEKLKELEQDRDVAAASAACSRSEFEKQDRILNVSQEACENAKTDFHDAVKAKREAIESRPSLESELEKFAALRATFLVLLEDESCQDRQQKLEEVQQGLQAIGTEASLVTAAVAALTQTRGSRSKFEEVSAKAVGQVFVDHSAKLEKDLVKNASESEDGPVADAELLHDAMQQNAANKQVVLTACREALSKNDALLKAARKEAKQQAQTLATSQTQRDDLLAKSADLTEVLAIVEKLTLSTDPPSPGPIIGGASDLLSEAAEADTQDAGELLGNELINAVGASEAPGGDDDSSPTSLKPSNLEGAFDLAVQKSVEEQATEPEAACAEPPAKKPRLSEDVEEKAVAEAKVVEQPAVDVAMAPADEVAKSSQAPAEDIPVDILSSGGA